MPFGDIHEHTITLNISFVASDATTMRITRDELSQA
jgi:hypothetical protein